MKGKLNIIVPCYNEEKVIIQFYNQVSACAGSLDGYVYSILFVDDGSSDGSLSVIQRICERDDNAKFISFSRNFGKESAMLAALEHSDCDCAVIMDADLQHPPELMSDMIALYEKGYDQVIAKRDRAGDPVGKSLMAKLYYKLINSIIDVNLKDGAGDYRLISRPVIDALVSMKESNRFSKGLYSWVGFKQTYINYENQQRAAGDTKWSFRKLFNYGVDGMLSFNTRPLKLCLLIGIIFIFLSIVYLGFLLVDIIMTGIDLPGYFTTIAIICMLGGIQLFSLGVIGEYVGKIYQETKNRPAYIVKKTNLGNRSNQYRTFNGRSQK